ncbi:unnamed protein product [Hymenolepis diminuta]|uniref:HMG box domain-containing protein n=1 Tax=Hymenolepis diminuta TaxID=6216 RepID=A0A158QCX2_HYMDI|nr:unnamed protein product [Hymenolepis diminuta]
MEKTSRMYGGLIPPGMIGSFGGFMGAPPPPPASNFYDFSALQHHQQQRLLHQQTQRPSSNSATSNSSTSGSSLTPSTTSATGGPGGPLGNTGSGNPAADALSPCSTSSASALHSELFNAASGFYGMAAYGQPMSSHFGMGPTSPYATPGAGRHFAAAAAAAAAVLGSCFYPTRSPPDASNSVFPAAYPPSQQPSVSQQQSSNVPPQPQNSATTSSSQSPAQHSANSSSAVAASASAAASAAAAAAAWLSSPLAAVAAANSPSFTPNIFNHVPPHNRQAAAVHFLTSLTAAAAASSAASSSSASSPLQPPSASVGVANPTGTTGAPPASPFASAAAFHHSLAVATNGGADKLDMAAGSPHAAALSLFALSPASPAAAAVAAYCQSKTGMQFGSSMLNPGDPQNARSPLTYTQLQPASQQQSQKDSMGGDYGADSRTSRYHADSNSSKRCTNNRSSSSLSGAGGDKHSPSRKLMRIGSVGSGGSPLSSAAASSSLDQCCSPGSPQTLIGTGGSPSKTGTSTSASASSPGLTINAATLAQYRREITTENSGTGVPTKRVHIKKPLNAFMLFMKEMRPKIQEECTLKESAAINQILGKKWHELSKPEQSNWSARDNYAIHSKRKRKRKLAAAVAAASAMNSGGGDGGSGRRDLFDGDGYFGGGGNGGNVSGGSLNSSNSAAALAAAAAAGVDLGNPKKCRARFGLEQQTRWCKPCRRKKKCVRFLTDAEYDEALKAGRLQSEPSSPQQPQTQQSQQNTNKSGSKDQWMSEGNLLNKSNPKSPNSGAFLSPAPSSSSTGFVPQSSGDFVGSTNPLEDYTPTTSIGGGPFSYPHFSPYGDFQRPSLSHSTLSFLEQQTRSSIGFGAPVPMPSSMNSIPVSIGGNNTVHQDDDDDMKNETLCVFATEASPAGSCHHDNGGDDDDDIEGDNFPHIKQEPSPLNGMFPVVTAIANVVAANSKVTEPVQAPSVASSTEVPPSTTAATTTPSEKRSIIFSAAALSRCEEPLSGSTAVETGTTAS